MDWFKNINRFYQNGFWTKEMVGDAVRFGKISEEQYQEITSEIYSE